MEALAAIKLSRKDVDLGPRPGQRIRSGVFAPSDAEVIKGKSHSLPAGTCPELDEPDEAAQPTPLFKLSPEEILVNLDGSDSDLEVTDPM